MLAIEDETQFIAQLRSGDEQAFITLVETHHSGLMRMALIFTSSRAVAEELVQETWLAVIDGIAQFQARSSVKTWVFAIMANKAKTRAVKDARMVNLSEFNDPEQAIETILYDQDQGCWNRYPRPWVLDPEEQMVRQQMMERIRQAIDTLPIKQKLVMTMRDIQGFSSKEICEVMELTPEHERVLLFRARSVVRLHLEAYMAAEHSDPQEVTRAHLS